MLKAMISKSILTLLVFGILSGCTIPPSPQELSGYIGCPPSAITVGSMNQSTLSTANFTAYCHGVTYYCSKKCTDSDCDLACSPAQ